MDFYQKKVRRKIFDKNVKMLNTHAPIGGLYELA